MAYIQNNQFIKQLSQFIAENKIVGYTAGVCVALVTKDVISSLVGDIVIPGITNGLQALHVPRLSQILPVKSALNVNNFIKQFITWLIVLILTYIFIKVAFYKLLGVNDNVATAKEQAAKTADPAKLTQGQN